MIARKFDTVNIIHSTIICVAPIQAANSCKKKCVSLSDNEIKYQTVFQTVKLCLLHELLSFENIEHWKIDMFLKIMFKCYDFFRLFCYEKNRLKCLHYLSSGDDYTCAESTIEISKQWFNLIFRYREDQLVLIVVSSSSLLCFCLNSQLVSLHRSHTTWSERYVCHLCGACNKLTKMFLLFLKNPHWR